jgi:hypothetical protein
MFIKSLLAVVVSAAFVSGAAYGDEPLNNVKSSYVGTFSAGAGRVLKILATNPSETRLKFELDIGVAKGKTSCEEGDVSCVSIEGVAALFKTVYFQNEDSSCTLVMMPQGNSVEITQLSGGCGTGTGNVAQLAKGNGKYVRKTGPKH